MAAPMPGLCSVTFRGRSPDEVLVLAVRARLRAVEWGADVHVRPGDATSASAIGRRCRDAGVDCPSYGSYFVAGDSDDAQLEPVLASASALGAGTVRVWAAGRVDEGIERNQRTVEALAHACDRAARVGLDVALEFHPGTLTENAASTRALLAAVDQPNLFTYWQPLPGASADEAMPELEGVLPRVKHVHVFAWRRDSTRQPLAEAASMWGAAFERLARLEGRRCAYLEFVRDDDPASLERDAATLRSLLGR